MSEETFRWVVTAGVGLAAVSMLAMAVMALVMSRVVSRVEQRVDSIATQAEPLIETARRIAIKTEPKIYAVVGSAAEIAENVKDISDVAKDQAHRFAEVGRDIADRTKAQVARVDAAVDETVEKVHDAGENVKTAVLKPVHEASAVMAGVKAAFSVYSHGRRPTIDHVTQDEEMFI